MALALKDRVKETTTTTGTGTVTLAGAAAGFQSFAAVGNGNQTFYAIVDAATGAWEVGVGTYTSSGTTLSRTTVVSSSNAGSLVDFGAGSKDVFVTYPSSRSVYLDAAGSAVTTLDIGTLGASTANISTANITAGTVSTAPTSGNDLVNKTYVDTIAAASLHYHEPVFVESPDSAGNLNATYNNGTAGVGATLTNAGTQVALTIDGVLMTTGKRVLIYNQTNGFENGVYTVTTVGSGSTNWVLTRATDADTYAPSNPNSLGQGDAFFVTAGNTGAGETYVCNTVGPITFGTTNITFVQISDATVYTASNGVTLNGVNIELTPTGTAGTYGDAATVPVLTTNAYGQITSVAPTAIAISGAAVSGSISGQAGSVANALTAGTYLTSGGTYDGSAARTFAVDATSANTASKVVARDASGDFSAGTITATLSGAATSATTATNLAGGAANRIAYQTGSGTTGFVVAPSASNQVINWNGSAFTWSAGTISGIALGSNLNALTAGTYLTSAGTYDGSTARTFAVDATTTNTASKVVARDASGNFSAGTITAALSGNASTATTATNQSGGTVSATTGVFSGLMNTAQINSQAQVRATGWYGSNSGTYTGLGVEMGISGGQGYVLCYNRDTAAYNVLNFNATSFVFNNSVTMSGNASTIYGPNSSWGAYLQVGGNGRTVSGSLSASVATTNGNLHLDSGSDKGMYLNYYSGTAGFFFGNGASGTIGTITNAGALTMNNNITAYSDERLKKDWSPLPADFIERLAKVKAGTYTRIDGGERQAGSSAQEWQTLLPEVVMEGTDEAKTLSLAYGNAALVAAVKLAERVVALEARIAALEAKG